MTMQQWCNRQTLTHQFIGYINAAAAWIHDVSRLRRLLVTMIRLSYSMLHTQTIIIATLKSNSFLLYSELIW